MEKNDRGIYGVTALLLVSEVVLQTVPIVVLRRFMDLVSAEVGKPAKVSVTSKGMLRVIGLFSPFVRELVETAYQFERTFGLFEPTPHEEAVARTVAWFCERR